MMLVDQISTRRNEGLNASQANSTATIGLVVHAAADGIALGAAATTSHQDVEMIVFLAIMLHKAPGTIESFSRSSIFQFLLISYLFSCFRAC